ncbi:RNA polymerase factor sigma-32 [Pararhizobium sp. IMCC21322]|uniref:RNA polymerase factor sigma-32 n=1 Tax=Pararhizobium sp. IMCC21322 TaxID=3067903 RepID=UPI0027405FAB|nr:RNA polymerase factor sigma-32 [Pararhizobium sp. IMCC21322]
MSDDHSARRKFVRSAMKAPYLEREEEHQLAVRWKEAGDQEALHKLTSAHMRLVISVAGKFRYFGLSMSDLIQEGHVGLLEAAARFDPAREVRFSTYATWWIRASIQDHILRNWSIVRGGTSSAQKSLFFNLRRLRAKLTQANGGVPTHETFTEIASAIGVSVKDVANMNSRLSGPDMSLNAPLTESDGESADRQDFLVDETPNQGVTVPEAMDRERRSSWLKSAMTVLSERELRIVRDRRLSEEGATLESLGNSLGISKERVRQIECRALEKLKTALVENQPNDAAFI